MAKEYATRKSLIEELKALLSTNARLSSQLRNEDRTLPKDSEDLAQFLDNDEALKALESRSHERIGQIQRPILRIDAGTYRTYRCCGNEIGADRLQLLTATPTRAS